MIRALLASAEEAPGAVIGDAKSTATPDGAVRCGWCSSGWPDRCPPHDSEQHIRAFDLPADEPTWEVVMSRPPTADEYAAIEVRPWPAATFTLEGFAAIFSPGVTAVWMSRRRSA